MTAAKPPIAPVEGQDRPMASAGHESRGSSRESPTRVHHVKAQMAPTMSTLSPTEPKIRLLESQEERRSARKLQITRKLVEHPIPVEHIQERVINIF